MSNNESLVEMKPSRLLPGDQFFIKLPTDDNEPYIVTDRIVVVKSHFNLMETMANQTMASHETYLIFGTCGWKCYLKLSDMTSYYNIADEKVHLKFPDTIFLANQL